VLSNHVATNPRLPDVLPNGTPVRVRSSLGSWAGGFEVVCAEANGYVLRRVSDGTLLPTPIQRAQVKEG